MKKLTINLITRNRPELALQTIEITRKNIKSSQTCFMVSVDDDDEPTIELLNKNSALFDVLNIAPREDDIGSKYSRVLQEPADLYMPMVDYVPFVEEGFDVKYLEAASLFPDGIGVVHNYMANASFPYCGAVTHKLVEKMGFFYPPYFPYWFVDHWVDEMALRLDRYSFAPCEQQVLPRSGGTQEYREPEFWSMFFDVGHRVRRQAALDIINGDDFIEPEWRKEIMRRKYPIHEYHSEWINKMVRMEGARAPQHTPDDRYLRLRAKAQTLALKWLSHLKAEAEAGLAE